MLKHSQNEICARIAEVRVQMEGPRGKASFAKKLGLSASTYDYYESNRVPPADVLVRIADMAKVDLRWLLTGQSGGTAVPADHPAVARAAELLARCPDAAGPLAAFVELLAASMEFPAKSRGMGVPPMRDTGILPVSLSSSARQRQEQKQQDASKMLAAYEGETPSTRAGKMPATRQDMGKMPMPHWIPVLGRSAAGVPQFWRDGGEPPGLTTLDKLIDRNTRRAERSAAMAQGKTGTDSDFGCMKSVSVPAFPDSGPVQLITLSRPDSDNVAEFISAPALKSRYADAFAVRIDGESMSPDIRHGDLVVLSPSVPAADGKPAVVQLSGQIGVTCKLYRRDGQTVHLVPVNEQYPPQSFPTDKVLWALGVLAKIRGT